MMALVAIVFVVATASVGFALRPEVAATWTMWAGLGLPYAALGGLALYWMHKQHVLAERLRPKWGDISIGILVAAVLGFCFWGTRSLLTPSGSQELAWLYRIYLQLGPSDAIQRSFALTGTLVAIAALEEVVWRGLVLGELNRRVGERYGWVLTALLYAGATVPTAFTLADPEAGPNPLLIIAAMGCGLFWSFTARLTGRVPPVVISHMVFTYFMALQFRPPGL